MTVITKQRVVLTHYVDGRLSNVLTRDMPVYYNKTDKRSFVIYMNGQRDVKMNKDGIYVGDIRIYSRLMDGKDIVNDAYNMARKHGHVIVTPIHMKDETK